MPSTSNLPQDTLPYRRPPHDQDGNNAAALPPDAQAQFEAILASHSGGDQHPAKRNGQDPSWEDRPQSHPRQQQSPSRPRQLLQDYPEQNTQEKQEGLDQYKNQHQYQTQNRDQNQPDFPLHWTPQNDISPNTQFQLPDDLFADWPFDMGQGQAFDFLGGVGGGAGGSGGWEYSADHGNLDYPHVNEPGPPQIGSTASGVHGEHGNEMSMGEMDEETLQGVLGGLFGLTGEGEGEGVV